MLLLVVCCSTPTRAWAFKHVGQMRHQGERHEPPDGEVRHQRGRGSAVGGADGAGEEAALATPPPPHTPCCKVWATAVLNPCCLPFVLRMLYGLLAAETTPRSHASLSIFVSLHAPRPRAVAAMLISSSRKRRRRRQLSKRSLRLSPAAGSGTASSGETLAALLTTSRTISSTSM